MFKKKLFILIYQIFKLFVKQYIPWDKWIDLVSIYIYFNIPNIWIICNIINPEI